jgi:hypothetical protein
LGNWNGSVDAIDGLQRYGDKSQLLRHIHRVMQRKPLLSLHESFNVDPNIEIGSIFLDKVSSVPYF